VERWAEIALPVQHGWVARVVDNNLGIVLGYNNATLGSALEEQFPDGLWEGCAAGFDVLATLPGINPVDHAIWEEVARRVF